MGRFSLIGHTLTHSYSKRLFDEQHFSNADYQLCEMPSLDGLRAWVRREGIDGFNVTVPYKQAILPLLDALSPEAEAIGAVNCVTVCGGRLTGHNTDAPAFRHTLENILNTEHLTLNTAFILGTGGAARAVAYALQQMGIDYTFVSRTPELHPNSIAYNNFQLSTFNFQLLINATPVGMFPDVNSTPLDLSHFQSPLSNFLVYDLIYNPSPTLLMRQAAEQGAKVTDGLAMLRRQAELSWQLFGLQSAQKQTFAK